MSLNELQETVAAFDYLFQQGRVPRSGQGLVNSVTARAFFQAMTVCPTAGFAQSVFFANCDPPVIGGRTFRENAACVLCQQQKTELLAQREAFEQFTKSQNPDYQVQTWSSPEAQQRWETTEPAEDSCRFVCSSCVVEDTNQDVQLNITSSCLDAAFLTNLSNSINVQMQAVFRRFQGELGAIGVDVDQPEAYAQNVTQQLGVILDLDLLNSFQNSVVLFQQTLIEPGTNSIYTSKTSQGFNISSSLHAVQNSRFSASIVSQVQLVEAFEQFETNETLSDLVAEASETASAFSSLWAEAGGKVLIIVTAVFLIAVMVACGVILNSGSLLKPNVTG